MRLNENMAENLPQPSDTFVDKLKRPLSWLLVTGVIQFQYHEGMIFAVDQGGFILPRETFEEVVSYWRKFYDTTTDEEIEHINENQHLYRPSYGVPSKPQKQNSTGIVYVLAGNGFYKIGKTTNLRARLSQLTPKLPFEVELIHTIKTEDIDSLEEFLHEQFAGKRVNGEWFRLDENDIKALKQIPQ